MTTTATPNRAAPRSAAVPFAASRSAARRAAASGFAASPSAAPGPAAPRPTTNALAASGSTVPALGHRVSLRALRTGARLSALVASLLLPIPASLHAQAPRPDPFDLAARLDSVVPVLLERHHVPGLAVGVVEDARVAFTRGYGVADRASGRPMTDSTVSNLASLSKPVTAWGVLHLAAEQGLDLDGPVERWLARWEPPPSPYDWGDVTLRRILSHTAGLSMPSVPWFPADSARPSLDAVLRGEAGAEGPLELAREPGSRWSYSGGGYALLQLVVEDVSGRPFPAYMGGEVLRPLGMGETTFSVDTVPAGRLAAPHGEDGEPLESYRLVGVAAGGLYGTARDFARFLTVYMEGDGRSAGRGVLSPADVSRMLEPVARVELEGVETGGAEYALGHNVARTGGGRRLVFHSGGNPGYLAYFLIAPESGHGIVLLANGSGAAPVLGGGVEIWARRHGVELPPLY